MGLRINGAKRNMFVRFLALVGLDKDSHQRKRSCDSRDEWMARKKERMKKKEDVI